MSETAENMKLANLFYKHKNLKVLESKVNNELVIFILG